MTDRADDAARATRVLAGDTARQADNLERLVRRLNAETERVQNGTAKKDTNTDDGGKPR